LTAGWIDRPLTLLPSKESPALSLTRRGTILTAGLLLVVAVLAAACSSSKSSTTTSGTTGTTAAGSNFNYSGLSGTLNGSGSTFQLPFNQAAINGFQSVASGVTVNYAGGGSGKGKTDLQNQIVQWAGTDSLIKDTDQSLYKGGTVLYFPTVAAPITVSYHLSGVSKPIKLDGSVLGQIFSTTVKTWNAPAIAALNSGVTLPNTPIVVVHRSDASGTTNNFTHYLTLAASTTDWALGTGDTVNWSTSTQAGNGNSGVAQVIKSTNGAIGYVDFSDAKAAGLTYASIKNKSGSYEAPTLAGASAAVGTATVNPNLTFFALDSTGPTAYPITSATYVIVYEKQTDTKLGNALKGWLNYLLTGAQALAEPANFAPLPSSLQQKAIAQLSQLQIG
jgi:phosphate transport system substrate-binding protein